MLSSLSPVAAAAACDEFTCGHITRSSSRAVKRAAFLYLCEVGGTSLVSRAEAPEALAALALMRQGATCAEVLEAATPAGEQGVARLAAEVEVSVSALSPQVLGVMGLVSEGYSYPEIATEQGIAKETVRSHVKRAMRATQTHSSVEAASYLACLGLI